MAGGAFGNVGSKTRFGEVVLTSGASGDIK